jgi:WXG100 family type VII secretion target
MRVVEDSAELDQLAAQIIGTWESVVELVSSLEAQSGDVVTSWTGQASQRYQQLLVAWQGEFRGVDEAIRLIAGVIARAATIHDTAGASNSRMWV